MSFKFPPPAPARSKEENFAAANKARRKWKKAEKAEAKAENRLSIDDFKLPSLTVKPQLRQFLLEKYPALFSLEHAPALKALLEDSWGLKKIWKSDEAAVIGTAPYWRILQYVLYPTIFDRDNAIPLFSREIVSELVQIPASTRGFTVVKCVQAFNEDMFALNYQEPIYMESKAGTIDPEIDPDIITAMRAAKMREGESGGVDFVTGEKISVREQKQRKKKDAEYYEALFASQDKDHPAYALLKHFHEDKSSHNEQKRLLKKNWPLVEAAVDAMPTLTERQKRRKQHSQHLVASLDLEDRIAYKSVKKTPRIYSVGSSIHQFPREIRKIALKGNAPNGVVELDLRACQLAIVARIWEIDELQEFLKSDKSIWTELLAVTGLPAEHKPALKTTVYSIVFGMGIKNLRKYLQDGDGPRIEGIGEEAADKFFRHPLIKALLKARRKQLEWIEEDNGGYDAFDNWRQIQLYANSSQKSDSNPKRRHGRNSPSVLAAIVQSYELKIMLELLYVLKAGHPKSGQAIYILSFLHDGLTLKFSKSKKKDAQIRQMQRRVKKIADEMGVNTELEAEPAPPDTDGRKKRKVPVL